MLAALLEAEQLLELVDDDQQVLAGRDARQAHRFGQPAGAAAQRRIEHDVIGGGESLVRRAENVRTVEGGREAADRIFARPHDRHTPARTGIHHEAAVQRRNQSGPDQGGLAAP